jgi:hypothetical protein
VTDPWEATAGTWHDQAPAVADAARTLLRLNAADPDVGRLEDLSRAACSMIDQYLNLIATTVRVTYIRGGIYTVTYATGDAPPDVLAAATQLTAELFRRKDAPFGVLNAASANAVPMYVSRDQMAGVASQLAPYVEGFGFA